LSGLFAFPLGGYLPALQISRSPVRVFARCVPACGRFLFLDPGLTMLADLLSALQRIDAKLDLLIAALADESDEVEDQPFTLDGQFAGSERDQNEPL